MILFDRSEQPKLDVITRVSLADQIAEVKREIMMRKKVYVGLIDIGKMTPFQAEERTLNMEAVLQTLEGVRGLVDIMERSGGGHGRTGSTAPS